jgi:hypothetical protein
VPYIQHNAGTIIMQVSLTAAQQQALVANHYNLINSDGTTTDAGTVASALTGFSSKNVFDCTGFDYVKLSFVSGAQTGSVGGTLGLQSLYPVPIVPPSGYVIPAGGNVSGVQWFWAVAATATTGDTTIVPNMAQTQSSGSVACATLVTAGGKPGLVCVTLFFSTVPVTSSPFLITLQGY